MNIFEELTERYGDEPLARLIKLNEEIKELYDAYLKRNEEDIIDELADCQLVLAHMAYLAGETPQSLIAMATDKVIGRDKDPNYKRKHPHNDKPRQLDLFDIL